MKPQAPSINIHIDEDIAQGTYANIVFVTNSSAEVVLDFARLVPGTQRTQVKSRIIMTPVHAKVFLKSLEESVRRLEAQFGEIKVPGNDSNERYFGFRTPGFPEYKEPPAPPAKPESDKSKPSAD